MPVVHLMWLWHFQTGNMRNLQGKVVIVTGAANGIGKAIAERFVDEGCKVIWADVDESVNVASGYCPPGCRRGSPYRVSSCRAPITLSASKLLACLVTTGANPCHICYACR